MPWLSWGEFLIVLVRLGVVAAMVWLMAYVLKGDD